MQCLGIAFFERHPFQEFRLTPYPGGVTHDMGNLIAGITVSALAGLHDQLFAIMFMAKCLDPGLALGRISVSGGVAGFDFHPFVVAARARGVIIGPQQEVCYEPAYVFHLVSAQPARAVALADFHARRQGGLVKPESQRNLYTAQSDEWTINGVPILGFTLYQS